MGYDSNSITLLGCQIKRDSLFLQKYIPSCEHIISTPFCPECGIRNRMVEEKYPLFDEFDEFEEEFIFQEFYFIRPTESSQMFLVGLKLCDAGWDNNYDFIPYEKIPDGTTYKEQLSSFLMQWGITWDESTFGIYTIKQEDA